MNAIELDEDGNLWSNGVGRWSGRLPENVWIGTSVENQEQYDKRVPELLKIPAAVHFLSMEPLLGPVDIDLRGKNYGIDYNNWSQCIDWVIVGGESGADARPMHPDWVRGIRDQCNEAGIAFFFKQWGEFVPFEQRDAEPYDIYDQMNGIWHDRHWVNILNQETSDVNPGWLWDEISAVAYRKVGKKVAGRLLDGRTWDQFPQMEAKTS